MNSYVCGVRKKYFQLYHCWWVQSIFISPEGPILKWKSMYPDYWYSMRVLSRTNKSYVLDSHKPQRSLRLFRIKKVPTKKSIERRKKLHTFLPANSYQDTQYFQQINSFISLETKEHEIYLLKILRGRCKKQDRTQSNQ